MSVSTRLVVIAIAYAALVGCGVSTPSLTTADVSSVVMPSSRQDIAATTHRRATPNVRPNSSSQSEYVTDPGANATFVCLPCMEIVPSPECPDWTSGTEPQGVFAARNGLIYVAMTGQNAIYAFNASCSIEETLYDPGYLPADVAVAPDGTIGVTNICSSASCGTGNIVFYEPGSPYPTGTATGLMSHYYFGDFDKRDNFYNDGLTADGYTAVGVVKRGTTIDVSAGISGIGFPGGLQVARNGTVNIDDQACPCIQIYKNSKNVGTVTLSGAENPVGIALDRKNKHVWVADSSAGDVNEYAYPAGGNILRSIGGFVKPVGVGVLPAPP